MGTERGPRNMSRLFVAIVGVFAGAIAQAADQGSTTGVASFHAKGEVKEYKPGVVVWAGSFVGVSMTNARKGPLHNAGWDCTGETTISDGKVYHPTVFAW